MLYCKIIFLKSRIKSKINNSQLIWKALKVAYQILAGSLLQFTVKLNINFKHNAQHNTKYDTKFVIFYWFS